MGNEIHENFIADLLVDLENKKSAPKTEDDAHIKQIMECTEIVKSVFPPNIPPMKVVQVTFDDLSSVMVAIL